MKANSFSLLQARARTGVSASRLSQLMRGVRRRNDRTGRVEVFIQPRLLAGVDYFYDDRGKPRFTAAALAKIKQRPKRGRPPVAAQIS